MAKVTVVFDREGNTLDVWFTFLARDQRIHSKGDLKLEARVA